MPNIHLYYTLATGQREGGWPEEWQNLESLLNNAEINVRPTLNGVDDELLSSIALESATVAQLAPACERLFDINRDLSL